MRTGDVRRLSQHVGVPRVPRERVNFRQRGHCRERVDSGARGDVAGRVRVSSPEPSPTSQNSKPEPWSGFSVCWPPNNERKHETLILSISVSQTKFSANVFFSVANLCESSSLDSGGCRCLYEDFDKVDQIYASSAVAVFLGCQPLRPLYPENGNPKT
jgi:hypothetical protein